MQLTSFTDYALRVLLYLGKEQHKQATVREISDFHNISYNHLIKVVHQLSLHGYILSEKGRHGGISLARPTAEIMIGNVVRDMEPTMKIIECIPEKKPACVIVNECRLQGVLNKAMQKFLDELDSKSLQDLL